MKIIYVSIYLILSVSYNTEVYPCNVPVFRYALERWTADPYRLNIYYQIQLTPEQGSWISDLKNLSFEGDSTLNLTIQLIDLTQTEVNPFENADQKLTFPIMVLFYPEETLIEYPAWYGEFSETNILLMKNSPVRQEIAKRLLQGETAVWLFLESGDRDKDEKYFNLLQDELMVISETLKIPTSGMDIDGNPIVIDDFQGLKLNFSLVKVSRLDSDEEIFIRMLLGTESDLLQYQTVLTFPVFGQGRSLYALVGSGINSKTIGKACQSLVDWCSCEIKALHQGVDLLFLADWSERSGGTWVKDVELPSLIGLSNFIPQKTINDSLIKNRTEIEINGKNVIDNIDTDTSERIKSDTAIKVEKIDKNEKITSISQNIFRLFFLLIIAVIAASFFVIRKKS